jgi:hypothetical protein
MQMKDLLGGKGAILPERLRGLPYIDTLMSRRSFRGTSCGCIPR